MKTKPLWWDGSALSFSFTVLAVICLLGWVLIHG